MSKAFLRESDFDDLPDLPPLASLLPPGSRNHLTPAGARRLRRELEGLVDTSRPPLAAAAPQDPEAKRELQLLDQRIRYLQESLRTAEIMKPPMNDLDTVRFGATVTVRDAAGTESEYRIVGVDETDFDRGRVSWTSPLARALVNNRRGQTISFRSPGGIKDLTIVAVHYDGIV
jgi:transcription elongation factor GreB